MKKLLLTACICAILAACSTASKVEFAEANGFFFKNNQPTPTEALVIRNTAELEEHFGYATTMSSRPTAIDFTKQAAIAIVLPVTDHDTQISVAEVTAKGSDLEVAYTVKTGEKQSYSIQPLAILVVDKALVNGKVTAVKK